MQVMNSKFSLIFHRVSHKLGDLGIKRVPGVESLHMQLSKIFNNNLPTEPIWIPYEGYELKINPPDHVSQVLYKTGEYESEVANIIHEKVQSGDVVADIGAHIGHHTLSLRNTVGKEGFVCAFEPHPDNSRLIQETVQKNDFENIQVINAGLSDTDSKGELYIQEDNTGASSVRHSNEITRVEEIDLRDAEQELDRLGIKRLDFAKVDIQGGEYKLFVNTGILDRVSKMIVELHPGSFMNLNQAREVYNSLTQKGTLYKLNGECISQRELISTDSDIQLFWEFDE